jgi:hypothetical protein
MEAMNRKALIKTLSNDMSLVLMNSLSQTPEILSHRNSTDVIFRYRQGRLREYYFLNNMQGTPHCIRQTSCVANKVGINVYGKPYTGPDSVKIRHYNLRLSLNLYRIKENAHAVE